jgi:hypothetical protein
MTLRLSAFTSFNALRSSALKDCLSVPTSASGELHSGQRLANPGLPGRSSNSSPQTTHVLIGKLIPTMLNRVYAWFNPTTFTNVTRQVKGTIQKRNFKMFSGIALVCLSFFVCGL